MSRTPKHKGEIYFHDGNDDCDAINAAESKGFKFFTWGSHSQWYGISNHSMDYSKSGRVEGVPEGPTPTMVDRVMEYLARPERTERSKVMSALERAGFFNFGVTEEGRAVILHDLIENSSFCDTGKRKFEDFMGDTLPPKPEPKPKVQDWDVTLTLPERWSQADVEAVVETGLSAIFERYNNGWEDRREDWKASDIRVV